jgi:hypothetical protein
MKKRKQTIVGYVRPGWNIAVEDFGLVDVPLANISKKRKGVERVKITVENVGKDELSGVVIENTL